jgi:hypothetical protein
MAKDSRPRLRAAPLAEPFHIVLVDPEIPQNTGNIGRLSAATQCPLHLCGRLGFRTDEHAVRRAGLDYWHLVSLTEHADLAAFERAQPSARLLLFSAIAERSYLDADFRPGDAQFERKIASISFLTCSSVWPRAIAISFTISERAVSSMRRSPKESCLSVLRRYRSRRTSATS